MIFEDILMTPINKSLSKKNSRAHTWGQFDQFKASFFRSKGRAQTLMSGHRRCFAISTWPGAPHELETVQNGLRWPLKTVCWLLKPLKSPNFAPNYPKKARKCPKKRDFGLFWTLYYVIWTFFLKKTWAKELVDLGQDVSFYPKSVSEVANPKKEWVCLSWNHYFCLTQMRNNCQSSLKCVQTAQHGTHFGLRPPKLHPFWPTARFFL